MFRKINSIIIIAVMIISPVNFSWAADEDLLLELDDAIKEYQKLTRAMDQDLPRVETKEIKRLKREDPDKKTSVKQGRVHGSQDIDDDLMIDSFELKNMDIIDVLNLVSQKSGLNIVAGRGVSGRVSIYLKNVKLKDALHIVLDSNSLAYKMENSIVRIMTAAEYEAKYGMKFGGDIQTSIIRFVFADVKSVESLLNNIISPSGKLIADVKTNTLVLMDSADKLALMESLIAKVDVPIQTEVFELSYASVEDIAPNVEEILTDGVGKLKFDKRSNKMVVTDTPMKIKDVKKVVDAFDTKEKQVLIEAKIVQIILSDQHKFGVDWEAMVSGYRGLTGKSNFDILSSSDKGGILSIGTLASDDYNLVIEALRSEAATNILSSPSITTLNNEEAKILVGATEPYVTTTTTTPSSGPTTTAESVNFIDVGIKLYVTPTIHTDGFVTMKIRPEVSSVTKTLTTSNNNTIPVVETSEAETMVTVKDGITIMIGGLIKEEKIDSHHSVPFLGSIPLVGHAFKNDDELIRKTEIVIFLTPKIISGDVHQDLDEYVYR